jgi:hypothetical protein
MSRIFAAALLCIVALTLAAAQEDDKPVRLPMGGGRSYVPFEIIQVDGKTAWRAVGRGTVKVEDLVGGLSTALGKRVAMTSKGSAAARTTVSWLAPDTGVVIGNDELIEFTNDILAASHLVVVGMSGGKGTLAHTEEAAPYSPYVSAGELDGLPRGEWATVTLATDYADREAVKEAFQSAVAGSSARLGIAGNQLVMTGPVDQVRKALKVIDAIDAPGASYGGEIVKSYTLPATVQPEQAMLVLRGLFARGNRTVTDLDGKLIVREDNSPGIHAMPLPGNRILVRASVPNQALAAAAIAELK